MSFDSMRLEWTNAPEDGNETGAAFACAYRVLGYYRPERWWQAIVLFVLGAGALLAGLQLWFSVPAVLLVLAGFFLASWGYTVVHAIRSPLDPGRRWDHGVQWYEVTDDDHEFATRNRMEFRPGTHTYTVERGGDAEWTSVDEGESWRYRMSSVERIIRCGDRPIPLHQGAPRMSVPLRAFVDDDEVAAFVGLFQPAPAAQASMIAVPQSEQ